MKNQLLLPATIDARRGFVYDCFLQAVLIGQAAVNQSQELQANARAPQRARIPREPLGHFSRMFLLYRVPVVTRLSPKSLSFVH
jgi:hypothetical protein